MLKLERGKRVFSVMLVALVLFASMFAVIAMANTEKSAGGAAFESFVGNTQLSATVGGSFTYVPDTDDEVAGFKVTQESLETIKLVGRFKLEPRESIVGNTVTVAIGSGKAVQYMTITDFSSGFELIVNLNHALCMEYNNEISVVLKYVLKTDDGSESKEVRADIGVVTYDKTTGILGYPAGATYVASDDTEKALTTSYVPEDAKKVGGKVTVKFDFNEFTFEPNENKVADNDFADSGIVVSYTGTTATIKTSAKYEYIFIAAGASENGSVDKSYGEELNGNGWFKSDADTYEKTGLSEGATYSVWVRVPASDGVLASAPVFAARVTLLTEVEDDALEAFISKYEGLKAANKLYNPETKRIDGELDPDGIDALYVLYTSLESNTKQLVTVSERAEYLTITKYLAVHQAIILKKVPTSADKNAVNAAISAFDSLGADETAYAEYKEELMKKESAIDCKIEAIERVDDLVEVDATLVAGIKNAAKTAIDAAETELDVARIAVKARLDVAKLIVEKGVNPDADIAAKQDGYITKAYNAMEADIADADIDDLEKIADSCDDILRYARDAYEYLDFCEAHAQILGKNTDNVVLADIAAVIAAYEDANAIVITSDFAQALDNNKTHLKNLFCYAYHNDIDDMVAPLGTPSANMQTLVTNALADILKENGAKPSESALVVEIHDEYKAKIIVLDKREKINAAIIALKDGMSDADKSAINKYLVRVENITLDGVAGMTFVQKAELVCKAMQYELDAATAYKAFVSYKAEKVAEIEAMKDANPDVIAIADSYLAELVKVTFKYENIGASVEVYANTCKTAMDNIASAADEKIKFEKKRAEVNAALVADIAAKKLSDKYSADQIAQLESKLAAAIVSLNNLDHGAGKTIADIEAIKAASLADFATVNVSVVFAGDKDATDYAANFNTADGLWGSITNKNGMNSALALNIKKVDGAKELKGKKISVAAGDVTDATAKEAVDGKKILYTFEVALSGAEVAADNGIYTVKVLLPADVREATGLYVVSESGDTTYVYETAMEGNYIVFKTAEVGQFSVVCDKTVNLLWLIIVLAVLIVAEIVVVVFFIAKNKKKKLR